MSQGHDPFAPFRYRDYTLYLVARFFWTIGLQMQAVVVAWQIYEISNSALALGMTGLFEAVPSMIMALIAGHLVDQRDKKLSLLFGLGIVTFCSVLLLSYSYWGAELLRDGKNTLPIYLSVALSGIGRSFMRSAAFSLSTKVVPKYLYLKSSTWDSGLWQVAAVSGPAVGGIIYGFWGATVSYLAIVIALCLGLFFITLLKVVDAGNKYKMPFSAEEFFKGLKFVWNYPIMLSVMTLDMFAVLFASAIALLPIIAKEVLFLGPEGLGYLRAAPAVGSAVMAFSLAALPPIRKGGKVILWTFVGFGISTILMGLTANAFLIGGLLFLIGAFDNISVVVRSTIMKTFTPEEMRGRIAAINGVFIVSSNEIGAFRSGVTGEYMGTIPAIIFGGCMCLVVVAFMAWKAKDLLALDFEHLPKEEKLP